MADPALPPTKQPSPTQQLERQPLDLETLVAEHGPVLYRYAYRLTGLAADAEDLTQQVFLTALTKLDQLRDPAAARAWFCSVLRRAYLRSQRKPRPQPAANLDVDVDLLAVDLPEELAFDGEKLQRAIDELPEEFKLVLVGFYFEDCTYKELAERLELPIGTVMSRLSRAKGYLRTQLLQPEATSEPSKQSSDTGNGEPTRVADRVRGEAR
jgi:RNA polymerase sigma-70 factor (ECF subfamily)